MKLQDNAPRVIFSPFESRHGYLARVYVTILLHALKRSRFSRQDLSGLIFLCVAPILYMLGVKIVRSPIGKLYIKDRELLRSIVYGFFKTHFCYIKDIALIGGKTHFSLVVDVGANIGDFTLRTANVADRVIAIEPGKRNFLNLEANLRINSVANVLALNFAVTKFCEPLFMEGNTSDLFVSSKDRGEAVEGFPLDLICEKCVIRNIDVLKLDVQGHELQALAGMDQLLRDKSAKLIIIEVHLKRGVKAGDVVSFMTRYDYYLIHRDDYLFDQPHLYFMPASIEQSKT